MSPILGRIYSAPGGTEALDVLMKYMYAALPFLDLPELIGFDRLLPTSLWRSSMFSSTPPLAYLFTLTACG